jgi:diphthamide synthase (EF-2-diphthine--ammonia ligase)
MSKPRALVSWSSGKDSAFAFHELCKQDNIEIVGLLSTVTETYERVAMHGVRVALLKRQAQELGLPLHQVEIPHPRPNQIYERRMADAIERAQREQVTHIVFGDLEDARRYRETVSSPVKETLPKENFGLQVGPDT